MTCWALGHFLLGWYLFIALPSWWDLRDSTVTFRPVLLPQRTVEFALIHAGIFLCSELSKARYLATKIPGQKDPRSDSKLTGVPRRPSLVRILCACLLSLTRETGRGQVTHRYTSVHTTPVSACVS